MKYLIFTMLFCWQIANADTVTLIADRDNTLYEIDNGSLSNGVGSYIFEFISPFPNTEYEVTIDYPQFEEGGVVYFSKIANKTTSSLSIVTATASSDSNSNVVTTNHDLTYLNLKCVA